MGTKNNSTDLSWQAGPHGGAGLGWPQGGSAGLLPLPEPAEARAQCAASLQRCLGQGGGGGRMIWSHPRGRAGPLPHRTGKPRAAALERKPTWWLACPLSLTSQVLACLGRVLPLVLRTHLSEGLGQGREGAFISLAFRQGAVREEGCVCTCTDVCVRAHSAVRACVSKLMDRRQGKKETPGAHFSGRMQKAFIVNNKCHPF